jgi:hypothetical protein
MSAVLIAARISKFRVSWARPLLSPPGPRAALCQVRPAPSLAEIDQDTRDASRLPEVSAKPRSR